jgi:hypothetical protein
LSEKIRYESPEALSLPALQPFEVTENRGVDIERDPRHDA